MKLGYARVSTPDQKLDAQLDALTAAGCERIFTDTLSSTREDRPGLADALSHLRRDDMLVVTKLDRLGRSVKGLIALTEHLQAKGIGFQSLHETINTTTPMGMFFFHIMSACAELERALIVERTKTGLAAARARGRTGGRRRQMTAAKVRLMSSTLRAGSMTVSELARELQIHRSTVYDYVAADGAPTPLGQALLGVRAVELAEAAD